MFFAVVSLTKMTMNHILCSVFPEKTFNHSREELRIFSN